MADRKCTADGCEKPLDCKGLCGMHYSRLRRNGTLDCIRIPRYTCDVEGCERRHHANGLCSKHSNRLRMHGDPLAKVVERASPGQPQAELNKLLSTDQIECIRWPYGHTDGRPSVILNRKRIHVARALLISKYANFRHLHAAHKCGNAWCVNHAHVYWATPKQNEADKLIHGTSARGERQGNNRYTEETVISVFNDLRNTSVIASEFGMSRQYVNQIKSGYVWSWLTMPED